MLNYIYSLATDRVKGPVHALVKFLLLLLSWIYALAVKFLARLYDAKAISLDCKVISAGNITLGGTGKTVLVEYLARFLKAKAKKIAIVTRGYKRKSKACEEMRPDCESMGDEPFMLTRNLPGVPVIVNPDRVKGIRQAQEEYNIDTVILDDGFQQWGVRKDLDIVVIDSTNPFGNGHLLPRGILREGMPSLKRADIFLLTKTDFANDISGLKKILNTINAHALIFESVHAPVGFYDINTPLDLLGLGSLQATPVAIFSGIGSSTAFENTIKRLGINAGLTFNFRDHHNYQAKDLERIFRLSREKNINTLVTTEKDGVRLEKELLTKIGGRILALKIELRVKDEAGFLDRLLKLYSV